MIMMKTLLTAGLLGLLMAPVAQAQSADDAAPDRTIHVSGEGTIRVSPDMAVVQFGIVTRDDDAEVARSENAEASSAAMNAVRDLDIPEERIQMEALRLQPQREYNQKTRQYEERGFEAVRQVSVEVHDLSKLPTLIARIVQRGANRLQGVRYDLQDRSEARNEALRAATEDARTKAQLLAETLGAQLGPVRRIDEQNVSVPPIMMREAQAMTAKSDAAAPEPDAYAAGEMEVSANVQIVFDLRVNQ